MNPEQFATGEHTEISSVTMSDSPGPVVFKSRDEDGRETEFLYVFYQGPGNNGQLWYTPPAPTVPRRGPEARGSRTSA